MLLSKGRPKLARMSAEPFSDNEGAILMGFLRLWSDVSIRAKGFIVGAAPAVALIIAGCATYFAEGERANAAAWVTQSLEVRSSVQHILTLLLDAQSAVRVYGATRDDRLLLPYWTARTELPNALRTVKHLVQDNVEQTARSSVVASLVETRMEHLTALYHRYGHEKQTHKPIQLESNDWSAMEPLRRQLDRMLSAEDRLLENRRARSHHANRAVHIAAGFSIAIGLFGGFMASYLFTSGVGRRILLLEQNAQKLATGEKVVPLAAARDEIGKLDQAVTQQLAVQAQEIMRSEERFREQFIILQSVLTSIGDGVVVANREGQFLIFNPAAEQLLGLGSVNTTPDQWSQTYGVFLPDTVTPMPGEMLPLARAMRGEEVDSLDLFVRRPDWAGGAWISCSGRPLRADDGTLTGGVVVLRDITDRKRSEQLLEAAKQEAESANQAKDEFLSRMSHELRTPLNSVLGFAQLLQMGQLSGRSLKYVQHILKAGRHLLSLIDEVLDMSSIEAGKLAMSLEPVELSESIQQALDMVLPMAAASGIQICDEVGPDSQQYVTADRQRLQQVLLNLLSNAIKYNRRDGRIDVSSENLASGHTRVKISDTGPGISPAQRDRLFVPFERIDAGQDYVQGTGLGLALSKKLIEAMGGCIGVESQPEMGSTFWIDLPSTQQTIKQMERKSSLATVVPECLSAAVILYIEDNIENVRLMEHVLSYRPRIHLLFAMQGRMGLDLAIQHTPDLIFLDLHLPDLAGDVVLQQLRAHPSTRDTPIIVVSADATPGQIRRLKEIGATEYLTKPLDVAKFLRILDDYVTAKWRDAHISEPRDPDTISSISQSDS
jgi:signal transduction histidine kinase/CheY-like chemotaxis protein/CHASE3 domain sensor protein